MTITYNVSELKQELSTHIKTGEVNKARHILYLLKYSNGSDFVVVTKGGY